MSEAYELAAEAREMVRVLATAPPRALPVICEELAAVLDALLTILAEAGS